MQQLNSEEYEFISPVDSQKESMVFDSANSNNKSLLFGFPWFSIDRSAFGCYEMNARFHYSFSQEFEKNILAKHDLPLYDQLKDILNEISVSGFLPLSNQLIDTKPILRRLISSFLSDGIIGVCKDLYTKEKEIPKAVLTIAEFILKFIDSIQGPIYPWFLTNKDSISFESIKGNNWKQSIIRSFEWHPYSNKYAVAFRNDVVKIYSSMNPPVILKHQKQINVTCMAWKPFYSSLIAIGCENCMIIWDTDNLPVSIKPSSLCSFVLSNRYHRDIIDIKWYPKSEYLLSVASNDNQIMIWDIALKTCTPVKRIGTHGFSLVGFAPDGLKLFTADLAASFRVWNPVNYTSEKWVNLVAKCNAACWNPDSSILLFSCENCSVLYSLRFMTNNKQELRVVCDLSSAILLNKYLEENSALNENSITEKFSIGGSIQNICWDSTAQRIAISFKKYPFDSHINVVAVFIAKYETQFQLIPCGLINDVENSWPTLIKFKPKFDQGALLTIAWSNGRIQHVPLYFNKINDHVSITQPICNLNYNFASY